MALSSRLMAQLMERIEPGMKIASMGYPDIIATPEEVKAAVGDVKLKYLGDHVSARHSIDYPVPDAMDFFKALDVELTVYDIVKERGCEKILDLNKSRYEAGYSEEYDMVLDVGTLEHCFNIATALMNMAGFVKKNGFILHENPYNWGNHGFYNLNPTLFSDFYGQNGFEVEESMLVGHKSGGFQHECPAPPTQRFFIKNQECTLITVAKRVEIKQFEVPKQTKYKGVENGN